MRSVTENIQAHDNGEIQMTAVDLMVPRLPQQREGERERGKERSMGSGLHDFTVEDKSLHSHEAEKGCG